MVHSAEAVQAYLRDTREHSFEFHDMVVKIRSLFLETCSGLTEAVKCGGVVFLKGEPFADAVVSYESFFSTFVVTLPGSEPGKDEKYAFKPKGHWGGSFQT